MEFFYVLVDVPTVGNTCIAVFYPNPGTSNKNKKVVYLFIFSAPKSNIICNCVSFRHGVEKAFRL